MKTKRPRAASVKSNGKLPEPTKAVEEVEETAPVTGQVDEGEGYVRKGFSFYLGPDGKIAWEKMREKTRREFDDFLRRPDVAEKFGPKGVDSPNQPPPMFPPESLGIFFNILGGIEAFGAHRFAGISPDIAKRVFTYTDTERELLGPPLCKVLNKYIPAWMVKYQDEILLASLFLSITAQKIALAKAMEAAWRSKKAATDAAPTPPPSEPAEPAKAA